MKERRLRSSIFFASKLTLLEWKWEGQELPGDLSLTWLREVGWEEQKMACAEVARWVLFCNVKSGDFFLSTNQGSTEFQEHLL